MLLPKPAPTVTNPYFATYIQSLKVALIQTLLCSRSKRMSLFTCIFGFKAASGSRMTRIHLLNLIRDSNDFEG